ncbi:receptor L domain protein [Teladorsagia circumcincta]|uniref:Receptor L domain protein n=1 Tax=Teladorsagia circumcincta TaxID=45464 RepID=A0A2G9UEY0_TELCI|nr:receptor L domain protein [Teladorsagia circumcincta]
MIRANDTQTQPESDARRSVSYGDAITDPSLHNSGDAEVEVDDFDVCSGTSNGRSLAGSENRIQDLTTMYENCTRVYGNVEITHLTKTTLKNWTDADFSKKLKIFEHIQEIKGYLLIYNVDIRSIDFPNLKIIWGDDLLDDNSALTLSSNLELKELRMPKLRAIHKGNVRIENSTFLCYLQSKVNWNELLEDDAENRLITSDSAFRQCNPALMKSTECEHCWSAKAKYCQEGL